MCSRENLVELQGFEPWMKEPKSLVLPLHHNSIYILHINNTYTDNDNIEDEDLQSQTKAKLKSLKLFLSGIEERFVKYDQCTVDFII